MGGHDCSAPGTSGTHPSGPVGYPVPSLVWASPRANAASQPIRARFHYISYKVSQNSRVSPEKSQKACHSPCLQNGLKKSPLGFLGFLILPAFSHKELLGHFDPWVYIYCQNDEVSPNVHTYVPRSVRQIPPPPTAASCLLWVAPHLARRGLPGGVLNGPVFRRFTPDYD